MAGKGPTVPTAIAMLILGLAVGAAGGYYGRYFTETGSPVNASSQTGPANGRPPGPPLAPGGGGQQQPPTAQMTLAGTIRSLSVLEKVQGAGLTADQSKSLAPILKNLKSADTISADQATKDGDKINSLLTPSQKEALTALTPRRGGRGGGGGGMPGMGSSSPATSAPMVAGAAGGGGQQDPEKPFASERNSQALDDLIAKVGAGK